VRSDRPCWAASFKGTALAGAAPRIAVARRGASVLASAAALNIGRRPASDSTSPRPHPLQHSPASFPCNTSLHHSHTPRPHTPATHTRPLPPQSTYTSLRKLVADKRADGAKPRPKVAWISANSSGVSFRLDPYKITLIQVGGLRGRDMAWRLRTCVCMFVCGCVSRCGCGPCGCSGCVCVCVCVCVLVYERVCKCVEGGQTHFTCFIRPCLCLLLAVLQLAS
jgi:hypothetical protein